MTTALRRLAARAADDPFFLASALARYRDRHGLTVEELAGRLGCDPETLARVALCRRPRADAAGFAEDCRVVAVRFGVRVEVVEDAAWPW